MPSSYLSDNTEGTTSALQKQLSVAHNARPGDWLMHWFGYTFIIALELECAFSLVLKYLFPGPSAVA